ncbi:helix-turn-helix domain-containing protein [Actinospica sp. MGRD01-02]|uniref:Helix-turn-helix domain-containing protein n=1 Tax=Actinospica acidithermotolerans TaxID=2828514 RepID=A0A941E9D2_9ACTN|nr:helix-turn-helix transcriptional regulator [Actinospica acidithermotolerans]MBR7826403.1 helix-turn-helix domain-containing protein [Actinospica acidithermotolerans]
MTAAENTAGRAGPSVRRLILGSQLRRLREKAGISCAEAGYSIRGSASKISRLETGRISFKERDVEDLLTLYGLNDPEERQQLISLVAQSRQTGWWHRYNERMPKWFEDFVGLEEAAARIQSWELQFIPGLLQTPDYARAVIAHGQPRAAQETIDSQVDLRMRRQRILNGTNPPRLWMVVDESVLHRTLGSPAMLKKQIEHLLEAVQHSHISLQIVPFSRSGYVAEGAFSVLRFAEAELPDIAYIEHLTGALYLERPDELEVYGRAFDRLVVDAETPRGSRQLLEKLRLEL